MKNSLDGIVLFVKQIDRSAGSIYEVHLKFKQRFINPMQSREKRYS